MNNKIHIGLVEDQFLFREGMKAIINTWDETEVIFEASDGHSVISKLQQAQVLPDVMLVDLSLPQHEGKEFSGMHVTLQLIEHYPNMKVLILSAHDDDNFINRLIECGAHGYLVKDSDPQEVHEAIVALHSKGSYINERSLRAIQRNMNKKVRVSRPNIQTTKREDEILQLVCAQYTAEEIAEKLFISVKTVNGHRNNLLQKTGSRNVTGLVLYAIRNNIVSLV